MQLAAADLAADLARGLRPLYVLHGDEPLLAQEAADAIRTAARAGGYTERSVHTLGGAQADWGAVLAAGGSMSLFGERQIVEVRLPSGKPGKDGAAALERLAADARGNDAVLTLVELPRLDQATRKSAWFQALDGAGVSIELKPVERNALPAWIAQRLGRQGQRVPAGEAGQQALQSFVARVEGNLLAAQQEILKLALLYPPGELTVDQIEQAVGHVARYDVFRLAEVALAGPPARVQRMIDGLQAEGEAAVLVHMQLADAIRALRTARRALDAGRPLPAALQEARIWGPRQRLFERALPQVRPQMLDRLLHGAHVTDGIVKGLKAPDWPTDPWQALSRLAIGLCRECTRQQGRSPAPRMAA